MTYPANDHNYYEEILDDVTDEGDGWGIWCDHACLWIPKKEGVIPKIGDTARFYSKGKWHPIRGVFINGIMNHYMTEAESEQKLQEERDIKNKEKQDEDIKNRDKKNKRWANLPAEFTERRDGFIKRNDKWRWEFEPYELFVCEQAIEIANVLKNVKSIIDFHAMSYEQQKELVPALSDQHSGNTIGAAIFMAKVYLEEPEMIPKMHGALCPLVGCDSYGCWPTENSDV